MFSVINVGMEKLLLEMTMAVVNSVLLKTASSVHPEINLPAKYATLVTHLILTESAKKQLLVCFLPSC